jgi:heptosyltransferase-1
MGDVLHALPAVAALRVARPDWEIDWVVDPRWEALLVGESAGVVDRVYVAETKLWSKGPMSRETLRSVLGLRRMLREGRYDVVVDMQGTIRSAVIGWMAGGRSFVGFADPREAMAGAMYGRKVKRLGVHVVDQGAALLGEAVGVELQPAVAAMPVTPWAEEWAERDAVLSRPMCLLDAGGGWGAKQWPAERFGELAKMVKGMGFDVVVNAARKDNATALRVVEASGGAARMVVCNVAGLVALMRRVDLYVGGDTGPTHLAGMLAVPMVALFGPTDPARNGPWGVGPKVVVRDAGSVTTYKRTDEVESGLAKVSVERVVEAVREII